MDVIIESRLSGASSGYARIHAEPQTTINSLIDDYCSLRNIPPHPSYVIRNESDLTLDLTASLVDCGIKSGDVLYFTTAEQAGVFSFNNWWLLAALSFFIGSAGLVTTIILYDESGYVPDDFGVVFDAGSTHTSMLVYKWQGSKWNGTGAPVQIGRCNVNGNGIATYANNPSQLDPLLDVCIGEAKSHSLPGGRTADTRLYLGATAGMRLLNETNSSLANDILNEIRRIFRTSGFVFDDSQVRIITGVEEGLTGWVTANFITKALLSSDPDTRTMGTLDLGGASTQIAFHDTHLDSSNSTTLLLFGKTLSIYSKSYLCYGENEILNRHLALLILDVGQNHTVVNPCYPKNYSKTVNTTEIFNSPCTKEQKPSQDWSVTITGSGNSSQCDADIKFLLNFTRCNSLFSSCFETGPLPVANQEFVAMAGFNNSVYYMNQTNPVNPETFHSAVTQLCQQSWSVVEHSLCAGGDPTFPPERCCFTGLYIYHLLNSYGFDKTNWSNIRFTEQLNETDVGWTLGFLIQETNSIPIEETIVFLNVTAFILLSVLFALFLLNSFAFVVHSWRIRRNQQRYERLHSNETV